MNGSRLETPQGIGEIDQAGWATIVVALVIVAAAFVLASLGKLPMLGEDGARAQAQALPLVFAVVGVLLYVMASAKTRRSRFDLKYLPDYCFRAAQAVVYLYVIMAITAQSTDLQQGFASWPPNLVGLLVGMFILHVEKAMEGLGQRFEELLAALLPRALTARTARDKQLVQLDAKRKYDEMRTQSELLSTQIDDPAMKAGLQQRLTEVGQVIRDGDVDGMQEAVNALAWEFEEMKRALREEHLTVGEILAAGRS